MMPRFALPRHHRPVATSLPTTDECAEPEECRLLCVKGHPLGKKGRENLGAMANGHGAAPPNIQH